MAYASVASANYRLPTVTPLFIQHFRLPPESNRYYSTREICDACEKKSGFDSMLGAQRIGSLWRIYPKSQEARYKLLIEGIVLRGCKVTLENSNPFVVKTSSGDRHIDNTRVVIGNVPLSFSDSDIKDCIKALGVNILSDVILERDRDPNTGRMTRWLTGRRLLYIEVPKKPLPSKVQMGKFQANVYHKEQKDSRNSNRIFSCSNCLSEGHDSSQCTSDTVCYRCKQPGHKAIDCKENVLPESHDFDSDNETDLESEASFKSFAENDKPKSFAFFTHRPTPNLDLMDDFPPPPPPEMIESNQPSNIQQNISSKVSSSSAGNQAPNDADSMPPPLPPPPPPPRGSYQESLLRYSSYDFSVKPSTKNKLIERSRSLTRRKKEERHRPKRDSSSASSKRGRSPNDSACDKTHPKITKLMEKSKPPGDNETLGTDVPTDNRFSALADNPEASGDDVNVK